MLSIPPSKQQDSAKLIGIISSLAEHRIKKVRQFCPEGNARLREKLEWKNRRSEA